MKDNQETVLMFNNKGPEPLVVSPTFFSLSGVRLDFPAFAIPASSYREVDLRVLLANNLPLFEEGSLQVTHQGKRLQLGAQFKILKQGMLFDEQFVTPATRFPSPRMESVWWMPAPQSDTKFIVSNTTDAPVTATVTVDGTAPKQNQPVTIQLNPHQTRVLDILRDLVGQQQGGTIHKEGGISITHSGAPGAILARMLISRESTGYSSVINFSDSTVTVSSKLNGGGLRIGSIGSDELDQIVVARNVGSGQTIVSGRVPYTNESGAVVFVTIPETQIAAGKIKTIDVGRAVRQANVPPSVTFAGIELEYTTAPGSVIMTAQSVSRSGQQVFQVPLLDPNRMPSSAGGLPWKVDGDYTTVIFIKNETATPKKYLAQLFYEGGTYSTKVREVKPSETVALDFKQMRDEQTPDSMGNTIPLNVERGQIGWSMIGADNKTMSGRSEQVNTTLGISSTYACYNCCPNSLNDATLTPLFHELNIGEQLFYGFSAEVSNCYGLPSRSLFDGYNWISSNTSIGAIDYNGLATAMDGGTASMTGNFEEVTWTLITPTGVCDRQSNIVPGTGEMAVIPTIEIRRNNQVIANNKGTFTTQNVVAGEKISLTTSISGGTASSRQWTIPNDKAIKDYVVTYRQGEAMTAEKFDLEDSDLNQTQVNFYWIVGGNALEAKYTVTINGTPRSATAKFNVKKPTSTLTTATAPLTSIGIGTVQISQMPNTTAFALHYGEPFGTPGISFAANVTLPSGVTGDTSWAQTVNTRRTRKPVNGNEQVYQGIGLDGTFPDLPNLGDNEDSPLQGIDPPCSYTSVSATDTFTTYLLFKPQVTSVTTIYVPLREVSWNWSGTATRGADCNSWTITNRSRTANPTSAVTNDYPQWVTNVLDFSWQ